MAFLDLVNKVFPAKDRSFHKDLGRNESCWCGSGRKYKSCHMAADRDKRAASRA